MILNRGVTFRRRPDPARRLRSGPKITRFHIRHLSSATIGDTNLRLGVICGARLARISIAKDVTLRGGKLSSAPQWRCLDWMISSPDAALLAAYHLVPSQDLGSASALIS
jgi:hypothetical protein